MPLLSSLADFLRRGWRPLLYVSLASGVSAVALIFVPFFGVLLAAAAMFGIAYLFGERKTRSLFFAAVAMLFLTAMALTGFVTWDAFRLDVPLQSSDDGILTEGTVDPIFGGAQTTFTFRVVYTHSEAPAEAPRVVLNSIFSLGRTVNETMGSPSPTGDYSEGVLFVFSTVLPSDVHSFHFVVLITDSTWVVSSDSSGVTDSRGPINISAWSFFGLAAASRLLSVYLGVGIPLFLLLMTYWWVGEAKLKRGRLPTRKCPVCGETWPFDEAACPNCGFKA